MHTVGLATLMPPQISMALPVHAAAGSVRPRRIEGVSGVHRSVVGLYAWPWSGAACWAVLPPQTSRWVTGGDAVCPPCPSTWRDRRPCLVVSHGGHAQVRTEVWQVARLLVAVDEDRAADAV